MKDYDRLRDIAKKRMLEKGLAPEFPVAVLQQLENIKEPARDNKNIYRDMREMLWCSIDNDDSLDLDQITSAERLSSGGYKLYVAIADVDAEVAQATPIDLHAQINTTSVYTAACIFPMLPEKLSTNLTSLNEQQQRLSVVFEITLNEKMEVVESDIYLAAVLNYAKLTYNAVGAWLEGRGEMPAKVAAISGLADVLQIQDQIAQAIKMKRHEQGALSFETIESKPEFENGKIVALEAQKRNRAHELIENLMISANTASARYALRKRIPSLRRVVRVPVYWNRIVELAYQHGYVLPANPDAKALDEFLVSSRQKDPETYPDLSLSVIKLLGSGEYVVEMPGDSAIGHFGLALRDYTHSTAPNRRYPDLITQRLIKASLQQLPSTYSVDELESLASQCTEREDLATKVERSVKKSAAAMMLADHIGQKFKALVTGVTEKGTWVRLQSPIVEGKLISQNGELKVGEHIVVQLVNVDIDKGFIDFKKV